jgi:leader peptidase (prepilin peptidase) / N-methyltransferase
MVVAAGLCAVLAYGVFAVLSIMLAVVDAQTHRLPNRYVLPGILTGAVLLSAAALLAGDPARLLSTLGGGAACFAVFFVLRMLARGALGGGDVKLAGLIGVHLGFVGWEAVLAGPIVGIVLAGLSALILLAARRAGPRSRIALGPFLLAGAWFAIIGDILGLVG